MIRLHIYKIKRLRKTQDRLWTYENEVFNFKIFIYDIPQQSEKSTDSRWIHTLKGIVRNQPKNHMGHYFRLVVQLKKSTIIQYCQLKNNMY